jgi:hypothetical protein
VALPWIAASLSRVRSPKKVRMAPTPAGAHVVHGALVAVALAISSTAGIPSVRSVAIEKNDQSNFPHRGLRWIQDHPRANILNQYDWGGYFTWLAPEIPVAVDGRPDMYGDEFMDRHVSIWHAQEGWQTRLDEDGYQRVFGSPSAALVKKLRSTPGWRVAYEDEQSVVIDRQAVEPTEAGN